MLAWSSTTGDARTVGSINGAARLVVGDAPTCSVGSINDAARSGITGDARSVGSINDDARGSIVGDAPTWARSVNWRRLRLYSATLVTPQFQGLLVPFHWTSLQTV
jgi:hypothetical protein